MSIHEIVGAARNAAVPERGPAIRLVRDVAGADRRTVLRVVPAASSLESRSGLPQAPRPVAAGRLALVDAVGWRGVDLAIRVAAAVLVVLIVAVVAVVLGSGASIPVGDEIVVQVGDTLWSLASSIPEAPSVGTAVADIQELNGLGSDSLSAGQSLVLPRY